MAQRSLQQLENDDGFAIWAVKQIVHWHRELTGELFDVAVLQKPFGSFGGYVLQHSFTTIEIVLDSNLWHDLGLIIRSLLVHKSSLACIGERQTTILDDGDVQKYLSAPDDMRESLYQLIVQNLALGPKEFITKARETQHFLC